MSTIAPTGDSLQVLLVEYERVCVEIRVLEGQNDKIAGFGLTIIGAGAAYGLNQHITAIFVVLPFVFLAVFFYAVLQYHNIFWYGGYKRALERKINAAVGIEVLVWEAVVHRSRQRIHAANLPLVTIYFFLLIANCIYSFVEVYSNYGVLVGYFHAVLLIVFLVALLVAVRKAFTALQDAYDYSCGLLGLNSGVGLGLETTGPDPAPKPDEQGV